VKRFAPFSIVICVCAVALAQSDQGRITRHEFVPDLAGDEGSLLVSSGGSQPDAIVYRGDVLSAPEGGALREDEAPMQAGAGSDDGHLGEAGRQSPSFRPDRQTSLETNIPYYPVFTPSINPFKRVTAYDTVVLDDGTPILAIGPSPRTRIEAVGAEVESPDGPRDRFWGTVVLDFTDGEVVPFPSVAPGSRILTITTEPERLLTIERDEADNYYARSRAGGQVRVVFLMDALRSYFGAPLAQTPLSELDPIEMPASVRRDADTFNATLGLSRASSNFDDAIATLTSHFRAFEESRTPPRDSGNIYLDLATQRLGICRHRAYAFVISAHALNIRARFVQNEAHAWAEVEIPGADWLRVDLGGAANGLDPRGDSGPAYDPNVSDPLPRPPEYERAIDRARAASGGGQGSSGQQSSEGSGGEPGEGGEGTEPVAPVLTEDPTSRRVPIELSLDRRSFEVFRGRELEVTGTARGAGDTSGLRIDVYLRATSGIEELNIGATVTDENGRFRGVFGIDPHRPVGEYRLILRTPGNDRFAPAEAI
jgi:transglutaminase-like putative cysteine protease